MSFSDRPTVESVRVSSGSDRFGQERKVFGVMPFTIKVATDDSHGRLFVIEQANAYRGGPPRHLHHAQDEWFYAVEGTYLVEVGGTRHHLSAGDSLLAPQGVPHSWTLAGDACGRLLIAFQPAGAMEAFFAATAAFGGVRPHGELRDLFTAHGMEIVGPPLGDG